jgi:hypothetical protein
MTRGSKGAFAALEHPTVSCCAICKLSSPSVRGLPFQPKGGFSLLPSARAELLEIFIWTPPDQVGLEIRFHLVIGALLMIGSCTQVCSTLLRTPRRVPGPALCMGRIRPLSFAIWFTDNKRIIGSDGECQFRPVSRQPEVVLAGKVSRRQPVSPIGVLGLAEHEHGCCSHPRCRKKRPISFLARGPCPRTTDMEQRCTSEVESTAARRCFAVHQYCLSP